MSRQAYPKSPPNNIPPELRTLRQWANWHGDKVIRNSRTGRNGSSTDSITWSTFAQAVKANPDRLVFVFAPDDEFVGIDVDGCRDAETGQLDARAGALVQRFPTIYWEISLSGTGLHGIGRGVLPDDATGRHPQGIGIFQHSRYFVMTGNVLPGHETLGDFDRVDLAAFYREISPAKPQRPASPAPTLTLDDHDLLERLNREPGGKAARLLVGDATGYPDFSTARFALATKMSFYTDDTEQIAQIIRSSGLFKDADDERGRDRKAALDARNAVEQYVGPRYDPAYRTPPSIPSAPPLNATTTAITIAVGATCDEQLMAAQARIAELEANVAARERVIERERELRVAAEERAERLSLERSRIMEILRCPDLPAGQRLTHFMTVVELGARVANGEEQPDPGYRLPAVRIAEKTGQSPQTVRSHWKALDKIGVISKTNVRERTEQDAVDPETGEITTATGTREVTHIRVPENNIINLIDRFTDYERQETDKQHGGARAPKPVCDLHPEAGTFTRTVIECASCHQELSRGAGVYQEPASDESSGINLIGEHPVSNTVLRATKLIGETRRRSPTILNGEPPPSRDYQDHDAPHWVAS